MVQDRQKIMYGLLNGTIANNLEWGCRSLMFI